MRLQTGAVEQIALSVDETTRRSGVERKGTEGPYLERRVFVLLLDVVQVQRSVAVHHCKDQPRVVT
jgi:hypothetical protein